MTFIIFIGCDRKRSKNSHQNILISFQGRKPLYYQGQNDFAVLNVSSLNVSPLDDPGKKKIRCTPRGTKVVIYHLVVWQPVQKVCKHDFVGRGYGKKYPIREINDNFPLYLIYRLKSVSFILSR